MSRAISGAGCGVAALFAGLFLLGNNLDEEKKISGGLEEEIQALRSEYPDAYRVARAGPAIAGRLLRFAEGRAGTADAARARLLAADALEAAGEDARARQIRELVRSEGPGPEERGRAVYALGLRQVLQEKYDAAARTLGLLADLAPGSTWAARAERLRPYFEALRTRVVPPFEAEFQAAGGSRLRRSAADLAGRYALLHFWSAASPGEKARVGDLQALARRIEAREKSAPAVLGVNLDPADEPFLEATRTWPIQRPEHHDGLGFAGPLPRALGIPRVPHFLAIDPQGGLVYLGPDWRALEKALFPPPGGKKVP
jgi:hypothetical protein